MEVADSILYLYSLKKYVFGFKKFLKMELLMLKRVATLILFEVSQRDLVFFFFI